MSEGFVTAPAAAACGVCANPEGKMAKDKTIMTRVEQASRRFVFLLATNGKRWRMSGVFIITIQSVVKVEHLGGPGLFVYEIRKLAGWSSLPSRTAFGC